MKRNWTVFLVAAAVLAGASPTWATHNPHLGRFMQRDPMNAGRPRGGYQDGMNLYEYATSTPCNRADPGGRIVVVASGLMEDKSKGKRMAEMVALGITLKLMGEGYLSGTVNAEGTLKTTDGYVVRKLIGGGGQKKEDKLKALYKEWMARKKKNPCSLEQFVAIGHSDGATHIWRSVEKGDKPFQNGGAAFLGLVDLVRLDYNGVSRANYHDPRKHAGKARKIGHTGAVAYRVPRQTMQQKRGEEDDGGPGYATISEPIGTRVANAFQTSGRWGIWPTGWQGRAVYGTVNAQFPGTDHDSIWSDMRVCGFMATGAANAYLERVMLESKSKGIEPGTWSGTVKTKEF